MEVSMSNLNEKRKAMEKAVRDYLEVADDNDTLDSAYQDIMSTVEKAALQDMYIRMGLNKALLSKNVGISKTTLLKRFKIYKIN